MEQKELWQKDAGENTELPGVKAESFREEDISVTEVEILNEEGQRALNKPVGSYITLERRPLFGWDSAGFGRMAELLARQLRPMLHGARSVLVVGLGNIDVTPDALGPETLKNLIITRHLKQTEDRAFRTFHTVSAVQPGVLGSTGLESLELVRGAAERVQPDAIVVVDALAAASAERVCTTVQLSSSGIVPGSGVGNSRCAFDRQTLGVPVSALGVPTVMDVGEAALRTRQEQTLPEGMILTPRDIDRQIRCIGRLLGYGLNLALHPKLTLEQIPSFLL